ncbi:MAG TPA: VOC family protein [Pilimelia sp.]|nr:VOC family protein [Pilimelia sp.]
MQITTSAVTLTVDDERVSAAFLRDHLGFRQEMAADGFVSLSRPDAGVHIVYLRRGTTVLPEELRHRLAGGVILSFVVTDVAAEEARLRAAGAPITMPLYEQPWGERLFQITDPNGVVIELVEWTPGAEPTGSGPSPASQPPGGASPGEPPADGQPPGGASPVGQ